MAKKGEKKTFPKDFLWGASTSAHQVEGGNHNQWTLWEEKTAKKLAESAPKRLRHLPIWPDIEKQATDPANYISGVGIDHYNRYKSDFDLAKKLNLKALRFTLEWSRIEPEEGQWNQEAIDHYKDYIKELRKRGIEPVMNIWHWTMPMWFVERGGFKHRKNIQYFERFVQLVAKELTDDVDYVITLNEPNVYTSFGYLTKDTSSGTGWPPGEKSFVSFVRVYRNLIRAHRNAYYILKIHKHTLKVGVASQLANIQAKRPHNYLDEFITEIMRYFWNWWFLRQSRKEQDFIGLNYYFTDYYQFPAVRANPNVILNDLGWYMEPEGIYPLLLRIWAHYKKPIMITENGVADMHDQYRRWWLEETIIAMERAMSEGVNIIGYMHWSLLDNFEWASGWWPKFGLIKVDRENGMKRTIRPSAKWFAERIKKISS
jgi:beta-glucosidase